MTSSKNKISFYLLLSTVVLFLIGRLAGSSLFSNNWSFNHWNYLPIWYGITWFLALAVAAFLFWKFQDPLGSFFSTTRNIVGGLVVLFALLIVFQFDSFLYGGGNLRVAQIAQAKVIIHRWFEFGSILLVSGLFKLFRVFGLEENTAGVYAWRAFAHLCTALTLVGAVRLAMVMNSDRVRRFFLFVILVFGGQTLLYFGFIGIEPVIIPITTWFALYAYKTGEQRSAACMAAMWVIAAIGVFMHFSLVFLLPAAVYLTFAMFIRKTQAAWVAFVPAAVTYVGLLVLIYTWASDSLEFSKYLLFPEGKLPHSDYGIFSPRRIGDLLQLFFLAAPLVLVLKGTAFSRLWETLSSRAFAAGWLMAVGGTTAIVILDPINSIVLDFPRMIAYLTPYSFLFALLINRFYPSTYKPRLWLGILAAAALLFPLSYLPSYTSINHSEPFVTDYLDKHDVYYRTACVSYRDAYFYRAKALKEDTAVSEVYYPGDPRLDSAEVLESRPASEKALQRANEWEWKLPAMSPDYLNLRGCRELFFKGEYDEPIRVLNAMIARHPYWTGPRVLLISIQMKAGRYNLAKPHIDTCLMLEPYAREHHIHLYSYYRSIGNIQKAHEAVVYALELFPGDPEIETDYMLLNYRLGNFATADSLSQSLIAADSTLPFPHLVRGLIEDRNGNFEDAIDYYRKFITLGPNEVEVPMIQQRLDSLLSKTSGE
jgi:tetratricopeptide (TPR) repeat protein